MYCIRINRGKIVFEDETQRNSNRNITTALTQKERCKLPIGVALTRRRLLDLLREEQIAVSACTAPVSLAHKSSCRRFFRALQTLTSARTFIQWSYEYTRSQAKPA